MFLTTVNAVCKWPLKRSGFSWHFSGVADLQRSERARFCLGSSPSPLLSLLLSFFLGDKEREVGEW